MGAKKKKEYPPEEQNEFFSEDFHKYQVPCGSSGHITLKVDYECSPLKISVESQEVHGAKEKRGDHEFWRYWKANDADVLLEPNDARLLARILEQLADEIEEHQKTKE